MLSAPRSQLLHPPKQIPRATPTPSNGSECPHPPHVPHGCRNVGQPGIRNSTFSSSSSSSILRGRDAVIVCVQGTSPSRAFLASSAGLALLRASENGIGGIIVFVALGVLFAMSPTTRSKACDLPAMEATSAVFVSWCPILASHATTVARVCSCDRRHRRS